MARRLEDYAGLVEVFDTPQEAEAMVVQGLLESAGIESLLKPNDDVLRGVEDMLEGVAIYVSPEQADDARKIIEEYRNAPEPEEITGDEESEGA
jgi:hypothetical protein